MWRPQSPQWFYCTFSGFHSAILPSTLASDVKPNMAKHILKEVQWGCAKNIVSFQTAVWHLYCEVKYPPQIHTGSNQLLYSSSKGDFVQRSIYAGRPQPVSINLCNDSRRINELLKWAEQSLKPLTDLWRDFLVTRFFCHFIFCINACKAVSLSPPQSLCTSSCAVPFCSAFLHKLANTKCDNRQSPF